MKRPKCPYCGNVLVKAFYNGNAYLDLGFVCHICRKIFLNPGWEVCKDPLYIGLKEVNK